MPEKPPKAPPRVTDKAKTEVEKRRAREAEALRANLRKRKAVSCPEKTDHS